MAAPSTQVRTVLAVEATCCRVLAGRLKYHHAAPSPATTMSQGLAAAAMRRAPLATLSRSNIELRGLRWHRLSALIGQAEEQQVEHP